jgi:AcrR family transcriptional regulator
VARPRSAGFEGQRAHILAVAAQLFAQRGYSATAMSEVAQASGVPKSTLYHYVSDKPDLLVQIATQQVQRLQAVVAEVKAQQLAAQPHFETLVVRFMGAYEHAQAEHRVLTEDVKFMPEGPRTLVLDAQREVVQAFADALKDLHPQVHAAGLTKPAAMLLFGMMNWTFTWFRAQGPLSHQELAQLVLGLMRSGLAGVQQVPSPALGP